MVTVTLHAENYFLVHSSIRRSISFDPDLGRHFAGTDMGPKQLEIVMSIPAGLECVKLSHLPQIPRHDFFTWLKYCWLGPIKKGFFSPYTYYACFNWNIKGLILDNGDILLQWLKSYWQGYKHLPIHRVATQYPFQNSLTFHWLFPDFQPFSRPFWKANFSHFHPSTIRRFCTNIWTC